LRSGKKHLASIIAVGDEEDEDEEEEAEEKTTLTNISPPKSPWEANQFLVATCFMDDPNHDAEVRK